MPTGNLDTTSGLSVMHTLADLQKSGNTIVVATHDPVCFLCHTDDLPLGWKGSQ
jgi:ABC-type lipoprotein export system ATPase subunit